MLCYSSQVSVMMFLLSSCSLNISYMPSPELSPRQKHGRLLEAYVLKKERGAKVNKKSTLCDRQRLSAEGEKYHGKGKCSVRLRCRWSGRGKSYWNGHLWIKTNTCSLNEAGIKRKQAFKGRIPFKIILWNRDYRLGALLANRKMLRWNPALNVKLIPSRKNWSL